ncbi:hypothetical protein MBLNU459_g1995t1 [Dothideomycetes sp. NU459]
MDSFSLDKLKTLLPFSAPSTGGTTDMTSADGQDAATEADRAAPTERKDDSTTEHNAETSSSATSVLEPRPITPDNGIPPPKSNLDLVNECDTFPYFQSDPALYLNHVSTYYHLRVQAHPDVTLGYVLPSVAQVLRGLPDWSLDDDERTLTLTAGTNEPERTAAVAATASAMRETGHFRVLRGWRHELYPVYGPAPRKELLFSIERAASALFGVVSYGVHCTAYTYVDADDDDDDDDDDDTPAGDAGSAADDDDAGTATGTSSPVETTTTIISSPSDPKPKARALKLWVPRRAQTKQTYGGMLDNTVAGGMATGETPRLCLVREASEEASLPSALVSAAAKSAGTVTYFHIRDERAGGETGLLQPECQYVYDLELPADVVPRPSDGEVDRFYLWGVAEVRRRLRAGEFKPNCAVVLLDFFVRHGLVSHEDEPDYLELVSRMHRKLEFPTV